MLWGAGLWTLLALGAALGCTTWTSIHGGYGVASASERSVAGVEVQRALGGELHSGYGLMGVRLDGSTKQLDASAHVGAMRALRLSESFTLAPSGTIEFVRISKLDGRWRGGAFGPAVAAELLWWWQLNRRSYTSGDSLGCLGGAVGVDCPRFCRAQDVVRTGVGLRASAEYNVRFGGEFPRENDWVLWLMLGVTRAASAPERQCCHFDDQRVLGEGCRAE